MNFVYRWLPPIVLFVMAAYVRNFNQTHVDSALLFPLLDYVPSLKGDLVAQADASWKFFAVLGGVVTVASLYDQIRHGGKASGEEDNKEA